MAQTTVVKVKVQELSKYGFKANDRYVGYSKLFKDQARIVPGAEFDAEFYIADSGKEYLNKIVSLRDLVGPAVTTPKVAVVPTSELMAHSEPAKNKFVPKFQKKENTESTTMSKAEWQAKDRSQLIGGLSHDAAALAAAAATVGMPLTDIIASYKTVLEALLKVREEVR